MISTLTILLGAAIIAPMGMSAPALAQDAAETAIILGGTGQSTGAASRSLGNAVRGSIGSAAGAVAATNRGGRASTGSFRGGGTPSNNGFRSSDWTRPTPLVIPAGIDSLAGSNAPAYRLGNGRTIKVSGRLTPYEPTVCTNNCDLG